MVSHSVVITNPALISFTLDDAKPQVELWKSDLWQHLQNVSGSSFSRSLKRKKAKEADEALCAAMGAMKVGKSFSLCDAFKHVCLRDTQESSSYVVQSANSSKTLVENKESKELFCLQRAQPSTDASGLGQQSPQRKCLRSDVNGNGETSSTDVQSFSRSKHSSC